MGLNTSREWAAAAGTEATGGAEATGGTEAEAEPGAEPGADALLGLPTDPRSGNCGRLLTLLLIQIRYKIFFILFIRKHKFKYFFYR